MGTRSAFLREGLVVRETHTLKALRFLESSNLCNAAVGGKVYPFT